MYINQRGLAVADGSMILNNKMLGGLAEPLQAVRYESGILRPYLNKRGIPVVTIMNQGKPCVVRVMDLPKLGINVPNHINNAQTLQKEVWIELDNSVVKATRQRLKAWSDLASKNPRGGFDAMSKLTYEYQSMNDPGEAIVDMDGISDGRADRPLFDLKSVPLPITHSDFYFSAREIAVSTNGGMTLDTTMAEAAGRRIGEMVERTLIGTETGVTFGTRSGDAATAHTGTSTVYGYTSFPYRQTKTDLTTPTGSNPEAIMTDVLEMVETMYSAGFFGPFMLYHSTPYSRFLNDDYYRTGSTSAVRTLRERILEIEGISDIQRLDYLTSGYQLLLIQMDPDVAQAITGMDIRVVQWETRGGMQQNFKAMAIMVPLLKTPYNGVSGILHGTTS